MPKMLLIFCDGTGNDGNLTLISKLLQPKSVAQFTGGDANTVSENCGEVPEMTSADTPVGGGGGGGGGDVKQFPTNVIRLARSVKARTAGGKEQIVFYQSGVGTEADFAGDEVWGTLSLQVLGTSVASKIRDAYAYIAQNYEDGDEICIFGFSRGAYTARKLSGLIDRIGLLTRQNLGQFFLIWRQLIDDETPTIPSDTRHPRVKCVGVWDTVGSVYATIDALEIKDTSLPATVDIALHAIALQENREKFLPTLWTTPTGGLAPNQTLKQVWFPGAHSDVGGGYERRELQDITLFWMVGEILSFIDLDLDFLRSTRQPIPEPWGTSQPHNAYMESSYSARYAVGHKTRLESGQITTTSSLHQSLQFSPQVLTSPDYMTTTSIIQKAFGKSLGPQYIALNAYETKCKADWNNIKMGAPKPPIFDDPGDLIRKPTVHWTTGSTGEFLPPAAIQGGHERNGSPLYIARAPYEGGLYPGKASVQYKCVYIGYNHKEIAIYDKYQFLVGDKSSVRWIHVEGQFSPENLGGIAVRGGMEADGEPLYIAQASTHGGEHCGKVKDNGYAIVTYGGSEIIATSYKVLVFT